ncbi:nuclear factor 7, ovary-like [Hippoglossus stenolepis]|uniref:nuclear factor 7, ovary-like n=1 Tax=Hippoglossus stenolepis TaxID=195615 RepID=UPI00159CB898|nr:nuclear factor 7, ovary-like [Hippoglossus stenolepis]
MMRIIRRINMSTLTVRNVTSVEFEEQFKCCICLNIYTDPVSTPCGHNFCLDCIEGYWDSRGKSDCPLCKQTYRKRPELRINREFAEIIDFIKRSLLLRAAEEEGFESLVEPNQRWDKVPCDICHRNKSPSVSSCLVCQASYCELHLTPHLRVPALQRHRLTDPATFTSSHLCRNHNQPLTMFCKKDQMPVCVKCTAGSHKHHEVVPMEKESKRVKSHLRATKGKVQQMIQDRLGKMEEILSSIEISKKITEKEIQSSARVCALLISAIRKQEGALVQELKGRQGEAERTAKQTLHELEQEINELQTRGSELQHLELTQNPLHLLQGFPSLSSLPSTREWSEVVVHPDNCLGTVRRAVSALVDVCQELADQLSAEETDKMNQYAVDVTLDPETASAWLVLSPDGKKVSLSSQKKTSLPNNPERFDTCVCVLGKQSFTHGRSYWEVQVGDKTDWDLGVARESINRKGAITVRPDSGYWAICRRKGGSLSACTAPSITLQPQETPQKVGIFLDYEGGSVSFYNAETKTHIYTYSGCSFDEPLHPYFNPCVQDDGKNTTPLVVCPLERSTRVGLEIIIETDL